MSSSSAVPIAAGAAVASSAAAGAASAAACTAAAAAIAAACAAVAASATACCDTCTRVQSVIRSPFRKSPLKTAEDEEAPQPLITPRTLSVIEADELLPRARAAQHVLHVIAEGNEHLLTAGILARLGHDTVLSEGGSLSWEFGGHHFAQAGAVGALGAAVIVTAPLQIPSNAVFVGGLALTHGLSLLFGAPGEAARALEQEGFEQRYGVRREELKWSVVPAVTLFWDLQPGDGVLELVLKAKRGLAGLGSNPLKLRRLLCRILDVTPGSAAEKAARLDAAIRKAAVDMTHGSAEQAASRERSMREAAADMEHPRVSEHLARLEREGARPVAAAGAEGDASVASLDA